MKNLLMVFSVFSLFAVFDGVQAEAQFFSPAKLKLGCKHIDPIQQAYLSRHINHKKQTANLEEKTVKQFLKKLDPSKIYLVESDIKKIKKDMKNIFAKLKRRECSSIKKARELYEKRVEDRIKFIKAHLDKGFKFDEKTELTLDSDKRPYAKNVKEAEKYHKKYLQFQIANYIASDEGYTDAKTKKSKSKLKAAKIKAIKEAKVKVKKNYDRLLKRVSNYRQDDLWTSYLNAYASSLDPHSSYFSAEMLEDFQIQMRLSLEGIGATLSSKDGFTVVEQLVPGGAAFKSGKLKPKDKIIAVAQGEAGPIENVVEMELRDVVRKIRGKKGTIVRLSILREGKKNKRFVVRLVRDKIKLEDDAARITYVDKKIDGKKHKIGLIDLPSFYADGSKKGGKTASNDLKKRIEEAKKKNVSGIVLDLSRNGGGSLDDAVKIAGLFFGKGNVVKQSHRDKTRGEQEMADEDKNVNYTGPLVILTSKLSASASEIVSGTLKDYGRAVIVGGKKTFGKGSVQSVEPLPVGLGALKTTVGMFFTAGGKSTQHEGVSADIVLPSVYDIDEIGEDTLDYSLPPQYIKPFLSKEAYVDEGKGRWDRVTSNLISKLGKASIARVEKSKDFKKVYKDLKKAKTKAKKIKVSEIFEDKDSDEDAEKDEKVLTDPVALKKEKQKKYMERADIKEVLNIMVDFIKIKNAPLKVVDSK